jgi:hypothetical protein
VLVEPQAWAGHPLDDGNGGPQALGSSFDHRTLRAEERGAEVGYLSSPSATSDSKKRQALPGKGAY